MSERFLHDDMLLTTPTSRQLYHDVATVLPIVDVHTHLSPDEIESDRGGPRSTSCGSRPITTSGGRCASPACPKS